MRPRAEDAVGADELQRVRGDRPHGVVGGVVEHHRHVEGRLAHQVERGRDRVAAAVAAISASVLPTASSFGGAAFAISICSGPSVPRMFSQPGSPLAMSRAIRRRSSRLPIVRSVPLAPPSCAQAGQDAREQRAARAVGVLVEAQVELGRGALEQLEQRLDQALVGERLEVGDVERCAGAAGDVDHLLDRLEQAVALVPDVGHERHAEAGRLLGDRDELVRGGVGARAGRRARTRASAPLPRGRAGPRGACPAGSRRSARPVRRRARGRARRRGRSRGRARARAGSRRARRGTPPPSTTATSPARRLRAAAGTPGAPRAARARRAPARGRRG